MTTRHVVECLASVAPPPPTPSSLSFAVFQDLPPITEDPREANTALPSPSGSIRRPIECLDVRSLDAKSLVDFHRHFMDSTSLRKLKLHTFHDVSDVCQVGDVFSGITWLWLPTVHLPSGSLHPQPLEIVSIRPSQRLCIDLPHIGRPISNCFSLSSPGSTARASHLDGSGV